ncbi:MAG: DNA internalization-related competence protein ComEC/Rec2 [Chloroflexota bacterium]|nr:DNA internalization-related competence protein ComEC/Rec2 [Chloroflexota bacterium]
MVLILASAAWIAGLLLGLALRTPMPVLLAGAAGAGVLALPLKLRRLPWWPAALAAVALLGMARASPAHSGTTLQALHNRPEPPLLEGVVVGDPEARGRAVRLVVDAHPAGQEAPRGLALVWARPSAELVQARQAPYFRYGDRLLLEGALAAPEPFQGFDYPEYLARQGIGSVMVSPRVELIGEGQGNPVMSWTYALRHRLADSLARSLPGEQAALAQALLVGIRSDVPSDLNEAFRVTGTSHILAISGQHVAVLLAVAIGACAWLLGRRRYLYLLAPLLLIWLYTLVSGFSPSVERSAIMGTVYLAALALGRPGSVLPALALASGAMAAVEPRVLQDISFQLSVTAVAGMALVGTPLAERWADGRPQFPGRAGLAMALAAGVGATLGTLPLIAFNFHRVSLVGIPATLLLLPVVPLMLVASAMAAIAGLVHPVLGQVVGWVAWAPLTYMAWLATELARLPGAAFALPQFDGELVWAYYVVGAWLLLAPKRLLARVAEGAARAPSALLPSPARRGTRVALALCLSVLAVLAWGAALSAPDGRLHVLFLDVGQGDAALIVTPGGRQVLVDGGPDPRLVTRALGRHMPFWDRSLDLVVATHLQEDHAGGLPETLRRYRVGRAMAPPQAGGSALAAAWRQTLDQRHVPVVEALAGQRVLLEEGIELEVLAPGARLFDGESVANNNGIVLRLTYGQTSFLFTADIEVEGELLLLGRRPDLRSSVLKMAHHGSDTSTSPQLLDAVAPQVAVVSVGLDNLYGHPSPAVVARLRKSGASVYTTALRGAVEVTTDGRRLWVRTER